MPVKLTFRDNGADALVARAKKMGQVVTLTVGIHESKGDQTKLVPAKGLLKGLGKNAPKGVKVIDVANWMEFGTATVPARSFIRAWVDENNQKQTGHNQHTGRSVRGEIRYMMRKALDGELTQGQALEILGLRFVGSIQERISKGIPPPLAQSTIDRKGSSTPLIDTGQLRSSVTHEVRR